MSIQWTFAAGYLYFEIGIVVILMLPIASPRRWNKFFKSRLCAMFREYAAAYFFLLLGVLALFLLDAIREMRKYAHSSDTSSMNLASEMKTSVKLFRAQRNFYITGFAIFLAFVIRRLVTMIIIQAELLDKSENIIKEAEAAKKLAERTVLAHQVQEEEESNIKNELESLRKNKLTLEQEIKFWKLKHDEILAKERGLGDN